ncbi:MAG: nuclear transport factor 2 family protein [Acidobacteriia bacterium]|nr:nuclear transport factor 2 family protein [Terriglobia bacterium]
MSKILGRWASKRGWACVAAAALILAVSCGAWAGQKKKQPKEPEPTNPAQPKTLLSTADQIDHNIGDMLAGFQLGDVELMHKYYAENVTFVRGTYDPPLTGWQNYVAAYNQQRAGFQGIQMIRRNTFIFTHGDTAWACYQWEFASEFNGRPYNAYGQTTLVFNKVGENWLIVHNHTSEVAQPATHVQPLTDQPSAPAPTPAPDRSRP